MTFILIGIILGVIGLDQLTKWLANSFLMPYSPIVILKDIFEIVLVEKNKGVAGSAFSGNFFVTIVVPVVGIVAVTVFLFRFCPKKKLYQIPLAMIVGGGVGNMIDRLFCDGVTDFISMPFLPWFQFSPFQKVDFPIFNVADSFITVGAITLMVVLIVEVIREEKDEKSSQSTLSDGGESHE